METRHLRGSALGRLKTGGDRILAIDRFVLHAGNSQEYPENSLPAFRTVPDHFKVVECDIINTKDNHWVLMHDMTIDRTTNGVGWVQEMTLAELRKYRIDTGPNINNMSDAEKVIPTLEEFLEICNERNLLPVIELRQRNYPNAAYINLFNVISRYRKLSECILMSFGLNVLQKLRSFSNTAKIWYLTYELSNEILNTCVKYKFDVNVIQKAADLTPEKVKYFQSKGISVGTWTMYDDSLLEYLLKCNVNHITTALNDIPEDCS